MSAEAGFYDRKIPANPRSMTAGGIPMLRPIRLKQGRIEFLKEAYVFLLFPLIFSVINVNIRVDNIMRFDNWMI